MATRKAPKRTRASGKTRREIDVRANVKAWVMRNRYWAHEDHGYYVCADDLLTYLADMDTRANARKGGTGTR